MPAVAPLLWSCMCPWQAPCSRVRELPVCSSNLLPLGVASCWIACSVGAPLLAAVCGRVNICVPSTQLDNNLWPQLLPPARAQLSARLKAGINRIACSTAVTPPASNRLHIGTSTADVAVHSPHHKARCIFCRCRVQHTWAGRPKGIRLRPLERNPDAPVCLLSRLLTASAAS